MLAKANWFKQKKKKNYNEEDRTKHMGGQGAHKLGSKRNKNEEPEVKSLLFVEQTPNGELARRLRETLRNMEPTLGFKIKVVERAGQKLGSKFPLSSLWGGVGCGGQDCITCGQGGDSEPPNCTQKNLVYENLCVPCNPGATGSKELEQVRCEVPTLYVG